MRRTIVLRDSLVVLAGSIIAFEALRVVAGLDGLQSVLAFGGVMAVLLAAFTLRRRTEQSRAQEALTEGEDLYRELFENASDMVYTHDLQGRMISINKAGERLVGQTRENALHMKFSDLLAPEYQAQARELTSRHLEGKALLTTELEVLTKGRRRIPVVVSTWPIHRNGRPIGIQGIVRDIDQRKRFDEQLLHLASHDPLTDLFNRRRFEEELYVQIAEARRYGTRSSLLFLDLDHFKDVNDTLGHWAGDELLADVGRLLRERLRASDIVARLGGDEFTIILTQTQLDDARIVADEILATLRNRTFLLAGQAITITASVGIAVVPDHGNTAEELLSHADVAMYEAKDRGRNCVCIFGPDTDWQAQSESRLGWRKRIGEALDNDLLLLYAQPILDLQRNEVSQYEVLVRMADRQGRVLDAGLFIKSAERYGLIQAVDRWVVRSAIQLAAKYSNDSRAIVLEVNISGKAFGDEELLPMIRRELAATGVNPRNLIFEVTETAAIHNMQDAREFINQLKAIGCKFALDDFGVGFSSFHQLKSLDVDYLKIDGSFIEHLTTDQVDRHLVKAMVEVARALNKKTVAEFVGDAETLQLLYEYGVGYAQGYYLGEPREAGAVLGAHAEQGDGGFPAASVASQG